MAMASSEETPTSSAEQYNYPWATSPDILRTHQKDAYMTGTLQTQLSNILRDLLGVRFAHKYNNATTHLSELIYLCLTTLLGNRTLGEEYCDVVQVEDDTLRPASLGRRASYIASVIFSPWLLSKMLPALRRKLRAKLERNIARAKMRLAQVPSKTTPRSLTLQEYILKHLDTLTSLSPIYAISLAAFYFTSSYYHLSKRLFRLRYIFTKRTAPDEQRIGYEVLGVLLVLQMSVQAALHIRDTLQSPDAASSPKSTAAKPAAPVTVGGGVELSVGNPDLASAFSQSNTSLLLSDLDVAPHHFPNVSAVTSTPTVDPDVNPNVSARDDAALAWMPAGQQRKCTLCLEPFRDPSVTTCGHVFCWTCVQDWVREKAECPLCRQAILGQKVLPLR